MLDDAGIEAALRSARRIAVIGASGDPSRPSYSVFRYLQHHGFDCVPINPNVRDILGVPAFRSLPEAAAATGPFDIVDVFRRSELCVPHAEEAETVRVRREFGIETLAIIADAQGEPIGIGLDGYCQSCGMGVAYDVGEDFLKDAEDG